MTVQTYRHPFSVLQQHLFNAAFYVVLAFFLFFVSAIGWSYKSGQPLVQLPTGLLQMGLDPEWLQYAVVAALLCVIAVVRELVLLGKMTRAETALLPDGFRVQVGSQQTQFRWEDITQVWQLITQAGNNDRQAVYRLRTRNGALHTLDAQVPNAAGLGQTAQQKITSAQFEQALADFKAGKAQSFGDIQLDPIGLLHKKDMFHWQQIHIVRVQAGEFQVLHPTKEQPVLRVALEEIPNLYLMLSLLCELLGRERVVLL